MKKKFLCVPFLATLALIGCTREDLSLKKPGESGDETGYLSVSIIQTSARPQPSLSQASTNTTKADGFENGVDNENYADDALFYIFDGTGNLLTGYPKKYDFLTSTTTPAEGEPNVEKIYDALLLINGVETEPSNQLQVVCVLNAPDGLSTETISTIDGLKDVIGDYRTDGAKSTFVMTNSVYKAEGATTETYGNEVFGVEVGDKVKKNADEAKNDPVKIYVERVVAKVKAASTTSFVNNNAPVPGTSKTLEIDIKGITLANVATKSYLFKNIDGIADVAATETAPSVNYDNWVWDPANKRSYWETVPAIGTGVKDLTFENKSWSTISENAEFDITNVNYTQYIQPNTSSQKTSILVTAQLMQTEGATRTAADLAYFKGTYTTKSGALDLIGNSLYDAGYCILVSSITGEAGTTNTYKPFDNTTLEWKHKTAFNDAANKADYSWLEDYEVIAQIKGSVEGIMKYDATTQKYVASTAEAVNTHLRTQDNKLQGRVYENGMCYYFVNIDQSSLAKNAEGTAVAAHTFDGVVRNHVYNLTLNSIKGVGVPVFDPTLEIIPKKPKDEELFYVAATVEVLDWKVVNQGIDF